MNTNQNRWFAVKRQELGRFKYALWRTRRFIDGGGTLFGVLMAVAVISAPFAGWVTNVIWTFNQTQAVPLVLGILGAIVFPIGVIHGIYLWF